jgi:18S rRNA (guanine1575-N7)-methyltransferase
LLLGDLGQGLPFRAGAFDGAVSISALQWLCNADKTCHNPAKRLYKFFSSLYACLVILSIYVYFFFTQVNTVNCYIVSSLHCDINEPECY